MTIVDLLFEYNEQRLVNDFGRKLVNRIWGDDSVGNELLGTKEQLKKALPTLHNPEIFNPAVQEIAQNIIQKITAKDPTSNKEYTFWIVLNYTNADNPKYNGGIKKFEDIGRAVEALEKFKSLLRKPNLNPPLQIRDINQIRGLITLEDIVSNYTNNEMISQSQESLNIEKKFYDTSEATLVYNSTKIKIVIPHSEKASCFFGMGTRWCTAAKYNNMFDEYKAGGPLYIIIIKGTNEKYQLQFKDKQFMNAKDRHFKLDTLLKKYPEILDGLLPQRGENIYIRMASSNIPYFLNKVASSKDAPETALKTLVTNKLLYTSEYDEIINIIYFLANNNNVTSDILKTIALETIKLTKDGESPNLEDIMDKRKITPNDLTEIFTAALQNKKYNYAVTLLFANKSPKELFYIALKDSHLPKTFVSDVLANWHCPKEILVKYANNPRAEIRYAVAKNHAAPLDILKILAKDKNKEVAAEARQTIRDLKGFAKGAR